MRLAVLLALSVLLGACEVVTEEHGNCSAATCGDGLSCVSYFDIGGNERNECLESCRDDEDCGEGRLCATNVADGPSDVCMDGQRAR